MLPVAIFFEPVPSEGKSSRAGQDEKLVEPGGSSTGRPSAFDQVCFVSGWQAAVDAKAAFAFAGAAQICRGLGSGPSQVQPVRVISGWTCVLHAGWTPKGTAFGSSGDSSGPFFKARSSARRDAGLQCLASVPRTGRTGVRSLRRSIKSN